MAGYQMPSGEEAHLIVRPLQSLAEHRALCHDPASWYARRVNERHHIIVALVGEQVMGGCAIEDVCRHWPHALVIAALEARAEAIAQALLHAVWRRATFIVAEDVPLETEDWWLGHGFERSVASSRFGKSKRVDMSRFRWDAPGDEKPLEPFWPASVPLGHLRMHEQVARPWLPPLWALS